MGSLKKTLILMHTWTCLCSSQALLLLDSSCLLMQSTSGPYKHGGYKQKTKRARLPEEAAKTPSALAGFLVNPFTSPMSLGFPPGIGFSWE